MTFENEKIAVLGIAKSGVALAKELSRNGASVFLSDNKPKEALKEFTDELDQLPVTYETGGHTDKILENTMIAVSPGVSVHNKWVKAFLDSGKPALGEVEIAWRLSKAPFVAVTGTNGKSTTVTLIHHMLPGKSVLAGNIGNPLVAEVKEAPENGVVVAEISSFQLETVSSFRPKIAILTNITPDHLDRHLDMDEYIAAKARLFANMCHEDYAIFSADDPEAVKMAQKLKDGCLPKWLSQYPKPTSTGIPKIFFFSTSKPQEHGAWFEDGYIWFRDGKDKEKILAWDYPNLPGPHNLANGLAAVIAAKLLGASTLDMQNALKGHVTLHYRMEEVRNYKGVRFIDDSKGTNPSSVIAALESFSEPLVLIAGGKDKGSDFTQLGKVIAERAQTLVLIGQAAKRLEDNLPKDCKTKVIHASTLQEAVDVSWKNIQLGGVVLLSPACSSFDMFNNAEERGRLFAEYAQKIV